MAGDHHQGDTPIFVPQLHFSLQWVRLPPLDGQEGDHHQLIVEIEVQRWDMGALLVCGSFRNPLDALSERIRPSGTSVRLDS